MPQLSALTDLSNDFSAGCGVGFKLRPVQTMLGNTTLCRFPDAVNRAYPTDDHLAVDLSGNIFGTTLVGGDINNNSICPMGGLFISGRGVVLEVTA